VPKTALKSVKLTPHLDDGTLSVSAELSRTGKGDTLEITVSLHDKVINSLTLDAERNHLDALVDVKDSTENAWDIVPWTPENTVLYDIGFVLRKDGKAVDTVNSYFAVRSVTIEGPLVLLNNEPYYQ
jgi:beta-galactosidase/beta-glucuronidase